MTQPGTFTPYSTVSKLLGAKPSWISDELDVARIQSYITYEEIYWNVPDVFKVSLRGTNEIPIYVPSARTIVDATNRYTAPGFGVVLAGPDGTPTPDSIAATLNLTDFFNRERFKSKFAGAKRYGIIKGDWIWHLTADITKPEGSRISIVALDPGMYFPITDEQDVDSVIGCHLVEQITGDDGNPAIGRLTYRKVPQSDGTNKISVEQGIFPTDKWNGPDFKPSRVVIPLQLLPDPITAIPVYHVKNTESPGDPFGSSELRGLEAIMGGINQVMSDEDLALALDGIGVYATDASQPIDPETKKPTSWNLGPGRVAHVDGTFFNRVTGVTDLADNYGAHYDRLWQALKQAASTPDVAIGAVDIQVATSGVALALQLGPMLAKASEKNQLIIDTHTNLFFDWLTMWEAAYEGNNYEEVTVVCTPGDAVPVDRVQRFAELNDMLDRGVIDTTYYRSECSKLGYTFPSDIGPKADAEFAERNPAGGVADPFAARVSAEAGDGAQS